MMLYRRSIESVLCRLIFMLEPYDRLAALEVFSADDSWTLAGVNGRLDSGDLDGSAPPQCTTFGASDAG